MPNGPGVQRVGSFTHLYGCVAVDLPPSSNSIIAMLPTATRLLAPHFDVAWDERDRVGKSHQHARLGYIASNAISNALYLQGASP
jgi:hypothetical protein